jgi:hypothetical protein
MEISTKDHLIPERKRKQTHKTVPCTYNCGKFYTHASVRQQVKHEAKCPQRGVDPGLRTIVCQDALVWLKDQSAPLPNVLTGIPDINELNPEVDYTTFFEHAAGLIFDRMADDGYAIFIQTDRKVNRTWISKSTMLINLGTLRGFKLCWHKIVLNRNVGQRDLFRPTYSHMLCFSKTGTSGAATPDVLPVSQRIYNNASPVEAVIHAVEFIKRYTKTAHVIIDPFVGQGTVPAIANRYHFQTIGIDIDPSQVEKAQSAYIPEIKII